MKKRIAYLSSLDSRTKSGGAFLRINATKEVLRNCDFIVDDFYSDDATIRSSFIDYLNILKYGKETLILFKRKDIDLRGYDYIVYDNLRHFSWNIKRDQNTKIIYNAHNIETENYYQRVDSRNQRNFLDYELSCIDRSMCTFVCSQREKEFYKNHLPSLNKKIIVLPNMVEKEKYFSSEFKKNITFLGTLDYYPNVKAIEFLCGEFSSYIEKNYPRLTETFNFIIAGRNPLPEQEDIINDSIFQLKKNLSHDEITGLLSCTYINLVPLLHGSGTRLKILEAIMSENIVLSTPLGTEGIENKNIVTSEINNFILDFLELLEKDLQFSKDELSSFYKSYDLKTWMDHNTRTLKKRLQAK